MWCCMYPSFFRFKRLVEHQEQQYQQEQHRENENNNDNNNNSISDTASITNITNNVEEFKILFRTQEKACYELRSENTVLKLKLEAANEMIRNQSKKIQSVKMKKNKLQIENNVYKNVLYNSSSLSFNNNHQHSNFSNNNNNFAKSEEPAISSHSYPPPPPPPLPLPPSTKLKVNGNFQMNSVLDELKSKIKKID